MNNKALKKKFARKAVFGKIPKTSDIEMREADLMQEYNELLEYENSEELKNYKELDQYVNSDDFKNRIKEINSQKYQGSEAQHKEQRYTELKKSKEIKTYFKVKESKELQHARSIESSDQLKRFHELQAYFTSADFEDYKKSVSDEQKTKKQEYDEQLNSYKSQKANYKWYYKFISSGAYKKFQQFISSSELGQYQELKASAESIDENNLNPKDESQQEYIKIMKSYKKLVKTSPVKNYLKVLNSDLYKKFLEFHESAEKNEYEDLKNFVESEDFKTLKKEISNITFENSDKYPNYKEYLQLKKDSNLKRYFKFINSDKYRIYKEIEGSDLLNEYIELENYIASDEFKETKKYLLVKDKFKLSDEYEQLQHYNQLEKSDKVKWYQSVKDSNKFDFIKYWDTTFEEDFDENNLNQEKWLTGYFWGKTYLNAGYSHYADNQFYTDGQNLEISDSVLKIVTKKEPAEGNVWNPKLGFYPTKFDYTSGLINTGHSFRQKYGIFKAKIKLDYTMNVYHAFWMLADKIVPEIDVFRSFHNSPKKLFMSLVNNQDQINKKIDKSSVLKGPDFSNDFFIYSIEWSENKIVWKINDVIVHVETDNLPDEPMYLLLSSGIPQNSDPAELPVKMEVDWLKVYQKKE